MKTLAVLYKVGEFGDGFWFLSEMDWPFERKTGPCSVESGRKILLSVGVKEVLVFEPQLKRKLSTGLKEVEKQMRDSSARERRRRVLVSIEGGFLRFIKRKREKVKKETF